MMQAQYRELNFLVHATEYTNISSKDRSANVFVMLTGQCEWKSIEFKYTAIVKVCFMLQKGISVGMYVNIDSGAFAWFEIVGVSEYAQIIVVKLE
jgi:hypothetical protein